MAQRCSLASWWAGPYRGAGLADELAHQVTLLTPLLFSQPWVQACEFPYFPPGLDFAGGGGVDGTTGSAPCPSFLQTSRAPPLRSPLSFSLCCSHGPPPPPPQPAKWLGRFPNVAGQEPSPFLSRTCSLLWMPQGVEPGSGPAAAHVLAG